MEKETKKDIRAKTDLLIRGLGGGGNIISVANCMTRLRVSVKDEALVDEAALRSGADVLGLVHDRPGYYEIVVGPGKSSKYAAQCRAAGFPSAAGGEAASWKQNKEKLRSGQKNSALRSGLKTLGEIFVPLIPGIIAAGLCAGLASLITQAVPGYQSSRGWGVLYRLLSLINAAFMTYITAWAGYRAAERFGATPILGGMLGMITSLEGINDISLLLGLFNESSPLSSVLRSGKGGVLAVVAGVFLLSVVEKKIRARMPESLDIVFTPVLSLLLCAVPYILIIMPALGYVSSGVVWIVSRLCMSESVVVRIIAGFVSTALFLPMVAAGMHHGLVALYSVQLQEFGYVTLYPALAMAGAGQVGAAIALWIKAKKVGNRKLCSVISGALPAGVLGIGEPLIYGVTLPLGKPFITAGLGAGFGGALVTAAGVASTTWGPSGLPGVFVMTAGPGGAARGVLFYLAGLIISYLCSFIITSLVIPKESLAAEPLSSDEEAPAAQKADSPDDARTTPQVFSAQEAPTAYRFVRHGEEIQLGAPAFCFTYTLKDPAGIHARPAGKLASLVREYPCEVTVSAGGKSVSAESPLALMSLGAGPGAVLSVRVKGREAEKASREIQAFFREHL